MAIIYRYGVSLLSRGNHVDALPEELLVDKDTGQILLKRNDGKIMSYDSMSRYKESVNRICNTAFLQCLFGKVYNVLLDNTDLPIAFSNNDSILRGDETIVIPDVKRLMLQFDVDAYDDESKFGDSNELDKMIVHLTMNGQDYDISLFDLDEKIFEFNNEEVTITKLTIEDTTQDTTSHLVLNNILILVK